MTEEKCLSRRRLLRGAGYSLAGLTLAGTMGAFLTGCAEKAQADPTPPGETVVSAPQWPLSYTKLDSSVAESRAYDAYKKDG
jgi:hypothetical protein